MAYLTGEPRVDVREIDLSQLITSSSSNVGVIAGQAERGPVMKRVFVTDDSDYRTIFGSTDTSKYGLMAPTALTFLEGSNQLYVTRVVGEGASFSGIAVNPSTKTSAEDALLTISSSTSYPYQKVLSHSPVDFSSISIFTVTSETSEYTAIVNETTGEATASEVPVDPGSVKLLQDNEGTSTIIAQDDGNGAITGDGVTGTVDYVTGAIVITTGAASGQTISYTNTEQAHTEVATLDDNGNIVMKEGQTSLISGRFVYSNNTITILSSTFEDDTTLFVDYDYLSNDATVTAGFSEAQMTTEDYDLSEAYPTSVIAIYSDNQGKWGNSLKVSVSNIDTTNDTFDITVFETVDNIDLSREVYHVSRREQLDGNGNQLYLEDVINGNSLYIRVRDLMKDSPNLYPSTFTKVSLTGAADGADPTLSQIAAAYELYSDWENLDVDILMDAGYVSETDITVQNKIRMVCEERQDCVGLLSVPRTDTSMSPTTDCIDWRLNLQGISSSYVGLYSPWVEARDTFKNKIIQVPVVGYVGAIMASLDDTYYAPAGLNDGVLKSALYPITGLTEDYKSGHRSALYDNGINVIKPYPGIGYVVWGQKTEQTQASATDRFNVRRSLNTIKRAVRKAYMYKLFKVNDQWTRSSLYNAVVSYMNTRRASFYDFKVICDETNNTPEVIDRNHIVLTIMVKPVKSAEYGILNIVITSTGVEFSSVEGSITV